MLIIKLSREPFSDFMTLSFPDNKTEDVECEHVVDRLVELGADRNKVTPAVDFCWNFYKATVSVAHPVDFAATRSPTDPLV